MIKPYSGRLLAAIPFIVLAAFAARADDPAGVLWETTSQMVIEGMPMPMRATTLKICTASEWKRPPPGGDPSCVTSDYKRVGNTATWAMQCGGKMPMTGTGEITFDSADSYTGAIKATAEGMPMTIRLSGKKVGTCDKPVD